MKATPKPMAIGGNIFAGAQQSSRPCGGTSAGRAQISQDPRTELMYRYGELVPPQGRDDRRTGMTDCSVKSGDEPGKSRKVQIRRHLKLVRR